jgi:hypothetical protein
MKHLSLIALLLVAAIAHADDSALIRRSYGLATKVEPMAGGRLLVHVRPENQLGTAATFYDSRTMTAHTLTPADLEPEGTFTTERPGRIFSASAFSDGRTLAVAFGWNEPKWGNVPVQVVAILDWNGKSWSKRRNINFIGNVRDVVAGPDNLVLAVTSNGRSIDPVAKLGPPLLTIVDVDGHSRGTFFRAPLASFDGPTAIRSRLLQVGDRRFALLDTTLNVVHVFSVQPTAGGPVSIRVEREVPIADVGASAPGTIRGFKVAASGDVEVVRSIDEDGKAPQTMLSIYRDGKAAEHRMLARACNAAFLEEHGHLTAICTSADGPESTGVDLLDPED